MKRSILIIAAVLLLGAGILAIVLKPGTKDSETASGGSAPPARDRVEEGDRAFHDESTAKASPRTERETGDSDLVEQYGDARTKLARNVSENVVGLLDDVITMGEMMFNGSSSEWNRGDREVRRLLRGTEIELTDEQQEQAEALLADFRKRELEQAKASVGTLRENPVPLMRLLLAGDARSRDELSEEDYATLQRANADALGDIINPLDRSNFRGGQPMEDEVFRAGFEALLAPEQAAALQAARTPEEGEEQGNEPPTRTDITQMPVMSLEDADEAIRSTRQMTGGFKQVMEGMGNLGPLLEQQRRTREGGETEE